MTRSLRIAAILVAMAALVVATRAFSLRIEVIDWDESTFMLMAQDILRGHLPYIGAFDNKPPGIFLAIAGAMALLGQSVATVRLFGGMLVFITAAICFGIARRYAPDWLAALIAAAMVAATLVSFGLHTSTELLSNVFIAGALWLLLARGERSWAAVCVGVLLSLATMTRTNLAFAVLAIGGLYLLAPFIRGLRLHPAGVIGYALGGLVPVALLIAAYASQDALHVLYVSTILVPLSYASTQWGPLEVAGQLWSSLAALTTEATPATALFFLLGTYALCVAVLRLMRSADERRLLGRDAVIVLATLASVLVSLCLGGIVYSHYLLQLYPFLAVLAALGGPRGPRPLRGVTSLTAVTGVVCALVVALPASAEYLTRSAPADGEYAFRRIAAAIRADAQPGDTVFALKGTQMALFYLDQRPLSPLATQPENLVRAAIAGPMYQAGLATADEFARILAERPRYILVTDPPLDDLPKEQAAALAVLLNQAYVQWYAMADVIVHRRTDGRAQQP